MDWHITASVVVGGLATAAAGGLYYRLVVREQLREAWRRIDADADGDEYP